MRQAVYADPFELADWSQGSVSRCFITIVNAALWATVTGEASHSMPPTASDYTKAGLPWFDYYNPDALAMPGSEALQQLQSVKTITQATGAAGWPEDPPVDRPRIIPLYAPGCRPVREGWQ